MAAPRPELFVRFDDFSGGYSDVPDPSRIGRTQWYGSNVMVYNTGLIGPRPGLKRTSHAASYSITNGYTVVADPYNPGVAYLVSTFFVAGSPGTFTVQLRKVTLPATVTSGASVATVTGVLSTFGGLGGIEVTSEAGRAIVYVAGSPTSTEIVRFDATGFTGASTGVPFNPGYHMVRWGDRLWVNQASRLWYTDAGAYTTWGATNFVDVGDGASGSEIMWLTVEGDSLIVFKVDGIWRLTGIPGSTLTVQRVSTTVLPIESGVGGNLGAVGRIGRSLAAARQVGSDQTDLLVGSGGVVWSKTGTWASVSTEVWGYGTTGLAVGSDGNAYLIAESGRVMGQLASPSQLVAGGRSFVTHHLRAPSPQVFGPYVATVTMSTTDIVTRAINLSLDRPGFVSDADAQPGDGSTTPLPVSLNLAAWYAGNDDMFEAVAVVVEFRKWNIGTGGNNQLDCVVRSLGTYEGGDVDSATAHWTEATSTAATTGTNQSWRVTLDVPPSDGIQVLFPVMVGVAIRSVTVVARRGQPRIGR